MGDIGKPIRRRQYEPLPEEVPIEEPSPTPTPTREPEPVPA